MRAVIEVNRDLNGGSMIESDALAGFAGASSAAKKDFAIFAETDQSAVITVTARVVGVFKCALPGKRVPVITISRLSSPLEPSKSNPAAAGLL